MRTPFDTARRAGQEPWQVEFHRSVGKRVAAHGLADPRFTPSLKELVLALEANPKQFPKKKGLLKNARAARLKFEHVTYRAVFILDEEARVVLVLSLEEHDRAYRHAVGRKPSAK